MNRSAKPVTDQPVGAKPASTSAAPVAHARGAGGELEALLALVAATVLVLFGLFMGWQAWLAARQSSQIETLAAAQKQAARQIEVIIDRTRQQVNAALAQPWLLVQLAANDDGAARVAAAQRLAGELADAKAIHLYSPQLEEVLHGDLRQLGYARAAQLMAAASAGGMAPAQSPVAHVLSFAGPIAAADGKLLAYASIDFDDGALRRTLAGLGVYGGRLELRETTQSGDKLVASVGDPQSVGNQDPGVAVAGSLYRLTVAPPDYWLPITRSPALAAALAVIALGLGSLIGWHRRQLHARGAEATDQPTLAEVMPTMQQAPRPAAGDAAGPPKPVKPVLPAEVVNVEVDPGIFRAYDIRGVVGKQLSAEVAHLLGRAIGSAMRDQGLSEIVVGRDGRLSGPELAGALIDGLVAAGMDVTDIGAVPTPVSYFGAYYLNAGSCVSVTGSHNPPDYNGFKIVIGGETLAEDAIQDLYRRIVQRRLPEGRGSVRQYPLLAEYTERIASDVQTGRALKVVVDCGNGIAGNTAPDVIRAIGCEVIPLYCEVDGNFPHHHPDPSDPANLADLKLMVQKTGADLGIAFDGDGDRLGVVTQGGEIIFPDRLLMLFARDVLVRNPGATILFDVKCTGHLQPLILEAGGSPLMWKTGHSLIKAKMKETGAQLAGEMSGHFFFRERWYGFDDGIYAAARLLEILTDDQESRSPDAVFAALPKGYSTPELHIRMQEGEAHPFVARFRQRSQFEGARITGIDGVRADWPDGWGLVRASNTTPVLVLRFDADTPQALKRIQDVFRTQLLTCDGTLELPF